MLAEHASPVKFVTLLFFLEPTMFSPVIYAVVKGVKMVCGVFKYRESLSAGWT